MKEKQTEISGLKFQRIALGVVVAMNLNKKSPSARDERVETEERKNNFIFEDWNEM